MSLAEAIDTLKNLGLTIVQAKVYIALASSGNLNITEAANISKVPRTDLYRVMKELEKRGLVERFIATPIQFKAIPIDECLDVLIQRRTAESLELQKKAAKMRQDPKYKNDNEIGTEATSRFILIPGSRAAEKIGDAIDSAKENIDVAISWSRFSSGKFFFAEKLEKAWQRNVPCRFVIGLPNNVKVTPEQASFHKQNPLCKVKFITSSPQTVLGIYDQREVFIIENPRAGLRESPALWSSNSSLISLAKDFFDILWITAMENQDYRIDE